MRQNAVKTIPGWESYPSTMSERGYETMTAPKMQVKCGVDTCHYWESQYCTASGLEVNPSGTSKPKSSTETECTTFKA